MEQENSNLHNKNINKPLDLKLALLEQLKSKGYLFIMQIEFLRSATKGSAYIYVHTALNFIRTV